MNRLFRWGGGPSRKHDDIDYESLPLASTSEDAQYGRTDTTTTTDKHLPETTKSSWGRRPAWLDNQSRTRYWLGLLLPFFVARPLGLTDKTLPKVGSTSYLNGIRGLACWIVVNFHITMEDYKDFAHAYGCSWDGCGPKHKWLFQIPYIRLLISGTGMVSVFFVLSGFVLSFSSLRRMNAAPEGRMKNPKTSDDLLTSLSSSALRRAIRLFLPLIGLMVFTDILVQIHPSGGINNKGNRPFFPMLYFMWNQGVRACFNPFNFHKTKFPRLFEQAWTLGVEYRMSLVVYLVLLFVCKLSTAWRKAFFLFAIWWSMYADRRWDALCFIGGMLVAEMRFAPLTQDLARLLRRSPELSSSSSSKTKRLIIIKSLATVSVLIGLLLVTWPVEHHDRLPWKVFWPLAPKNWQIDHKVDQANSSKRYFASIGSILLIWGLENLEFMQWCLSRSFLIYAGEISYAFYLLQNITRFYVHEPLRHYLTQKRDWSLPAAMRVDYVVGVFVLVVLSDYFWRMVDEPSVKVAQFLVRDCMGVGKKEQQQPEGDGSGEKTLPSYEQVPTVPADDRGFPPSVAGPSSSSASETSLESLVGDEEEEDDEKNMHRHHYHHHTDGKSIPAIRIE